MESQCKDAERHYPDTDKPLLRYVITFGEIGEDWIPHCFAMFDFRWWRWN